MALEGGCYCGEVRYVAEGAPMLKAQCHCRPCQQISGGGPNLFMLMPLDGIRWTQGSPKQFTRSDIEHAVTREFCGTCGTHLVTRSPRLPGIVLKVGTLDDPKVFGAPVMAVHTSAKQPFHHIPDGIPAFPALPPMGGR